MIHPDDDTYQPTTSGEYFSMAFREYAWAHGADRPDLAWINTPMDTWERNPHYKGPPARHPEDDCYDED